MSWIEVIVDAQAATVDVACERLEALGASAVSIEAGDGDAVLEPPPGATPLWRVNRVKALFADTGDPAALARRIDRALAPLGLGASRAARLPDRDWGALWRREARPRCFGHGLWVVPRDAPRPEGARAVVRLDPGLAFGTGAHPTTALCLEWLAELPLEGRTVLDLGSGSGVLAIAAAACGAARVLAVDHDAQARIATESNARTNGVLDRVTISGELPPAAAHVVFANILANTLLELAPRIARACLPGGRLVMSGILPEQVDAVWRAYAQAFLEPVTRARDGWAALAASRRGIGDGG